MDNKNNVMNADQYEETFSLKGFLTVCLKYWKWFALSVVFFVGFGFLYAYTRQPVYERYEEILVKDQESGSGVGAVDNQFSQLGLFSSNTKVYNELISFTSPAVMYEVVKNLDLNMNYTMKKGLKKFTLYGTNLPVIVDFPDLSEQSGVTVKMLLAPDGTFVIKRLTIPTLDGKKTVYKVDIPGKVGGGAIKSQVGNIVVTANPNYVEPEVGNDEIIDLRVTKQSLQIAVEDYTAQLKGDLADQDADVIRLSIDDSSIERADDILNTIVQIYNERWIDDNNKVALATSKFISERLANIEDELGGVDDEIADLKGSMRIPNLEAAAQGAIEQSYKINEELLRVSTMLEMSKFLKEYLEEPSNKYAVVPMNTGTENMVLEEQIGEYNQILLLRNNLIQNSSENNPLVGDYTRQLAGMRSSLLRSVNSQITNLQNAIKNIQKAHGVALNELTTSPHQAKSLLQVERQQQVMEELYLFLLQKREENELTQSFIADNIRIITPPFGNHKPVSPKKKLILIIAFIIGVGLPATFIYLTESSNTKIRSKKDLENLPVPFAGEIPLIGKPKTWIKIFQSKKKKQRNIDKPKVVVEEGKRDIPNEAFRVVRSNLDLMIGKSDDNVLALTSFNPGSGKSFVAYNLGASFALKGKRVLLIDGDLRHGSISAYVNTPRKGLTAYLTGGENDWHNLVVDADGMNNLQVLPIGHRPPNPAELLENGRLETLIKEARREYDIILIDCPPINIVVDTQIINQFVSRTLFVVRAGLLEKQALSEIIGLVDNRKLKNITVLLNGTRSEFSTYHTYGNYEAIDKH